MMISSTPQMAMLWVCVLLPFFLAATEATNDECSLRRFGELTMFNGETASVEIPCKVRLADFQCDDYRISVLAGQVVDTYQTNRFSVESLRVKITRLSTDQKMILRTSVYLLRKAIRNISPDPWMDKPINRRHLMDLDFVGFDSSRQASVVNRTNVFEILFSSPRLQARKGEANADEARVVVRCFHPDFVSSGLEESLCGDRTTPDALRARKTELYGCGSDVNYAQLLHHAVLNDSTVTQSNTCEALAQQYQSCPFQENTIHTCEAVMGQLTLAFCLTPDPVTAFPALYSQCLKYACDGDVAAISSLRAHVQQNCPALINNLPQEQC